MTSCFHIKGPKARHAYAYISKTALIHKLKNCRTLIRSRTLRVKYNHQFAALMTGSAQNWVLVSCDFGPRQLNGRATFSRINMKKNSQLQTFGIKTVAALKGQK